MSNISSYTAEHPNSNLGGAGTRNPIGEIMADWVVGIVSMVIIIVVFYAVTAWINPSYFTEDMYSFGDIASNEMQILKAKNFDLFTGHYSRANFYHPGPFFFYVMALGEVLFHDIMKLTTSPLPAHVLAIVSLNSICVYLTYCAMRAMIGGGWAALLVTISSIVSLAAMNGNIQDAALPLWEGVEILTSLWPPHFIVLPSLVCFASLMAVVAGHPRFIASLFPFCFVIFHGHASFIILQPLFILIIVFLAVKLGGRPSKDNVFNYARLNYRAVILATALCIPFIVPILIESQLDMMRWMKQYLFSSTGLRLHSPLASIDYMLQFWNWRLVGLLVLVVPVQHVCWRRSTEKIDDLTQSCRRAVLLIAAAATLTLLFYATFIIDKLQYRYLGLWYAAIPSIVVGLAILRLAIANRIASAVLIPSIMLMFLSICYVLLPLRQSDPQEWTIQASRAVEVLSLKTGDAGAQAMPVMIGNGGSGTFGWPEIVSIIGRMERANTVGLCVLPSSWHLLFHERHRCQAPNGLMNYENVILASGKPLPEGFDIIGQVNGVTLAKASLQPFSHALDWQNPAWRLLTPQLVTGWRMVEDDRVWMEKNEAVLVLMVPEDRVQTKIMLDLDGFTLEGSRQTAEVVVENGERTTLKFDPDNPSHRVSLLLPPDIKPGDLITVRLSVDRTYRAEKFGLSKRGKHGLCLRRAELTDG